MKKSNVFVGFYRLFLIKFKHINSFINNELVKISQHYKFRLLPNQEQEILLNQAIGSARFVWNQILAKSFEMFAKDEFIRYETIEKT